MALSNRLTKRTSTLSYILFFISTKEQTPSPKIKQYSQLIFTNTSDYSRTTADELTSIFTKRPFSVESQKLQELGLSLNTNIVETVLKSFNSWKIAQEFFYWSSNQHGYAHNCYTFNTMAKILSTARQNDSLRALAIDVVKSRCYMTPGALGFFIRCLGSQGLIQEANMMFDQVKKLKLCVPNNYSYNCLLDAISKSSNVDLINMRLNEMINFGWVLDKYALTPVLHCYCNAGMLDKALDVFSQMYEKGWIDGYVLSILVVSLSKWRKVDKAFEFIEKMEDQKIFLNEKTLCILIHGFVKEGRVDKGLELLNKMRNLGYSPDISIYGVLIGGLCKIKKFEKALQLCKQMNELKIYPDVKILCELISCAPEEKDMIEVLETKLENLDSEAKLLLFNSILKALLNYGSVDKACNLLMSSMEDGSKCDFIFHGEFITPDTTCFETVITGLCKANKLDMALELFRKMDEKSCRRSVLLYNNLIDCLSNCDRLSECYVLLTEMKDLGFRPTQFTHNSIFGCLCKREDSLQAIHMIKEMRIYGHTPWIKYYTLLIHKLCKHGRSIEACNFLSEMIKLGFYPDVIAYSSAIYWLFQFHEPERALQLFKNLYSHGYSPDIIAYNIVINGLCKSNKLAESEDVVKNMLDKGIVPSVVTYNLLIDGWCKVSNMEKAIECYLRMIEAEREPNVITYTSLIDGFCNDGKPNEAQKLWVEMKRNTCFPNRIAFMALINGLCKCGKPDEGIVYLREMEDNQMKPDGFVLVSLVNAFILNSEPDMAYQILMKIVDNKNFPDFNDKKHVILKNAIIFLSKDPRTSCKVKSLMDQGSIPVHLCYS